jgi:hypothetical protein
MRFYTNRHEGINLNKATIGALAMVLVGSVTFSFTNSLLTAHSTKKRVQTNSTTKFGDQKLVDGTTQSNKTVTVSSPTPNGSNIQTEQSLKTSVNQAEFNNGNRNEQPITVSPNNTVKISSPTPSSSTTASTLIATPKTNTSSAGTTSTKPTATSVPTTNQNTAQTSTTSNVPETTPAQPTLATTSTTTNRGQQVAQAAKEKAVSQQDKKVTN